MAGSQAASSLIANPQRGEVWQVALDPTLGAEIKKARPVVVLNPPGIGRLSLRIVAPLIGWKAHFEPLAWMVQI